MWRPRRRTILTALITAMVVVVLGATHWLLTRIKKPVMPFPVRHLCVQNLANIPPLMEQYEATEMTTMDKPWALFHGLLAHLGDYQITAENGQNVSCAHWLLHKASWQRHFGRVPLVVHRRHGFLFTHGPILSIKMEYEDHPAQFLYILQECGFDFDKTMFSAPPEGTKRPLRTILQGESKYAHSLSDVSWLLPGALKSCRNSQWGNKFGTRMDFDRLFSQHLDRQEHCLPCFATHWHMGLALALKYGGKKVSRPLEVRDQTCLCKAIDGARRAQSESGRFELHWRDYLPKPTDVNYPPLSSGDTIALFEHLSHQGHMLEWLMVALPEEELVTQQWPHQAVSWLISNLRGRHEDIPYGDYSHCVHALRLYEQRMQHLVAPHNPHR